MDNKSIFAQNLLFYMAERNKSRKDVAEAIGVSYYTFTDWVKGKKYPRMDKVEKLADYFGIKKSDLIERKVTEEIKKDNDELASVIVKMRIDSEFLSLVKTLAELDKEQIASAKQFLNAFLK
jgi:transcriptional regulator with XRE-family HTH domain